MPPSLSRARIRELDWWGPLSCAVALVVYLAHGLDGILTRDLGVYSYAGQQVAEGVSPYLGILNRCGPLAHLLPGVGVVVARLVGADDVLGMRVLFVLISVACVGVTYLLGRDLFRSRLAGLASAGALLCFQGFIQLAAYGPREKSAMVLFLVAGLLAAVHQRWATTGVFVALGALTWQPVFLAAITGAVVAVLFGVPAGRIRALTRVAVGGLVPTVLVVGWYAAIGSLDVLVDDFLLINARYTQQSGFLADAGTAWGRMVSGFGASLGVLLLGMVALLALTTVTLVRRRDLHEPRTAALLGAGFGLLVAVLWTLRAYNNYPDAFLFLPFGAVGIGALANELRRRLPLRVAIGVTIAWTVVAATMAFSWSVSTRDDSLLDQRASVAAVLGVVPNARMLSIEAPEAMVLAGQRNPARLQLFGNGLIDYVDDTWPGGSAGYVRWVTEKNRPLLIALGSRKSLDWLGEEFDGSYRRVGKSVSWDWYVRRDAPGHTRHALRSALEGLPSTVEG